MNTRRKFFLAIGLMAALLVGCSPGATQNNTTKQNASGDVSRVLHSAFDVKSNIVTLRVRKERNATGEDVVDTNDSGAIVNYVTTRYPRFHVRSVRLEMPGGPITVEVPPIRSQNPPGFTMGGTAGGTAVGAVSANGTIPLPPPGTSIDATLQPLAGLNAPLAQKENAIMQVATSKLGTPYVWGHSEDRGQYGFDCSNFTAYVYHHALGYRMSGASQTQYHIVGISVAKNQIRTGDLLVFDSGGHVGIYAGNGTMIQEGGGLKKVGYLNMKPGSYWWNHLTVVKRMF